ncbi:MAG TPA: hypothetical protein VMO26_08805 [Vicinamibacterales bacterium]|nr:hypothetical protein [Vicinamibacterales bacterium]
MSETLRKQETVRRQRPARTGGPPSVLDVKPRWHRVAYSLDRRDVASREELLRRVLSEYREVPGLRLTIAQATRLFGLRDDICLRVLQVLVERAILRRHLDGSFARNGV